MFAGSLELLATVERLRGAQVNKREPINETTGRFDAALANDDLPFHSVCIRYAELGLNHDERERTDGAKVRYHVTKTNHAGLNVKP